MRPAFAPLLVAAAFAATASLALANGDEHGHGGEPLFDSASIPVGESFELQMWREGPLPYHCHPHPWMVGTVHVDRPGKELPFRRLHVNISDDGAYLGLFSPDALAAFVGDFVVWHNNGTMPHTVTSDEEQAAHSHGDDSRDSPSVGAVAAALLLLVPLLRRRRGG